MVPDETTSQRRFDQLGFKGTQERHELCLTPVEAVGSGQRISGEPNRVSRCLKFRRPLRWCVVMAGGDGSGSIFKGGRLCCRFVTRICQAKNSCVRWEFLKPIPLCSCCWGGRWDCSVRLLQRVVELTCMYSTLAEHCKSLEGCIASTGLGSADRP